jgi:hypothetical protein
MFEFFFCPQHGLPAYAVQALPYLSMLWVEGQIFVGQLMSRFGRFA